MDRPQMRPVEAFPLRMEGREMVCLRDPVGLAEEPVFLDSFQLFVVSRLDGNNSLRDIQTDYCRATGDIVPLDRLEALVGQLNELHYLEGEDFHDYVVGLEESFRRMPVRPARNAGSAYQADGDLLRRQIGEFFVHPDGPGPPSPANGTPPLRGIVAPHIDFLRGGATYAHAYRAVADQSAAGTFVIFGTCHGPMPARFGLTEKDFETPLGAVRADKEFIRRLSTRIGGDPFAAEFAHRGEHSIELQVVFLSCVLAGKEFRIVPILVGSFHDLIEKRSGPTADPEVVAMVGAVRDTMKELSRSCCVVAGADLAHVGRRFGDSSGPTEAAMREVECRDREFLGRVEAGDAEGVFRLIAEERDRRRVCGYPPIYMMLACLEKPAGRLLQYRQWVDYQAGAAVTFASVAIY